MSEEEVIYQSYIACLNEQDWLRLDDFLDADVHHNGNRLGKAGYRAMIQRDFATIADLHFAIEILVATRDCIASRLRFDCSPQGTFLGLPVNGRRVVFSENVFYRLREGKIFEVWSILDKCAVEAQLSPAR